MDPGLLEKYASLRSFEAGDYTACREEADEDLLLATEPADRAELIYRKSWSLVATGNYRKAITCFYTLLHGVELQEHYPIFKAYFNLSIAYYNLQMWEHAHQALQKALEHGTGDPYSNAYALFQLFDTNKLLQKNHYDELFRQGVEYFHQVEEQLQRNRLLRMMLYCYNSWGVEVIPAPELIEQYRYGLDKAGDQLFRMTTARYFIGCGDFENYHVAVRNVKPVDARQRTLLELYRLHYRVLTDPGGVTEADLNSFSSVEYPERIPYYHHILQLLRPDRAAEPDALPGHFNIIGAAEATMRMVEQIERLRHVDENVLIIGESGSGKELVARALHYFCRRASYPFVPVNIAGIPESLFESELFGSRRGAYTGASHDRAGLVSQAEGGTLFLDEIGELPLSVQPKLLRFLETCQYREVGGSKVKTANVRILFATHQDLTRLVRERTFRSDLYFRINTLQIRIPPLRERRDDIGFLIEYFLNELRLKHDRVWEISPEARQLLMEYHFPGNVRELRNLLTQLCLTAAGGLGEREQLLPLLQPEETVYPEVEGELDLREQLRRYEYHLVQKSVREEGGDYETAARRLGISTRSLYRKLQHPDSETARSPGER